MTSPDTSTFRRFTDALCSFRWGHLRTAAWATVATVSLGAVPAWAGASNRWAESFSSWPADWGSPRQSKAEIRQVFTIGTSGGTSFLRAEHDAIPASGKDVPPAVHFGRAFRERPVRLADACILKWKWRVLEHPKPDDDAWLDLGASVYVVTKNPGLMSKGRGFKFGWLQKPGARGQDQRGILQIELRRDAAGPEFRSERIDLCRLYERHFGPVGDEKVLYVGVVTDADNTESRARADYTGFVLRSR